MEIKLLDKYYSPRLTVGAYEDICAETKMEFGDVLREIDKFSNPEFTVQLLHLKILKSFIKYAIKWGEKYSGKQVDERQIDEDLNLLELQEIFSLFLKIIERPEEQKKIANQMKEG
jgi:hypothetical protein